MLRYHVNRTAAGAKAYYGGNSDYRLEGQELEHGFGGNGAERLGLSGPDKEAFERLCDNLHPQTGKTLTQRQKADRIVGVDFTFDGPKGFAVLEALASPEERERLREALHRSALETLQEMEESASTRVRKGKAYESRTTGNLVWLNCRHDTTRPVGGVPDPQRHEHFFTLNATFDPVEGRWKAANLYGVIRDLPYYEHAFHQRLSNRLREMGYGIEQRGRYFEVAGIDRSIVAKFSRRTAQIEKVAKEKGIDDPREKSRLGAKTREGKADNLTREQLQEVWRSRLTPKEAKALTDLEKAARERGPQPPGVSPEQALDHAARHLFERNSAVPATELVAEALRYGRGQFKPEEAWAKIENDDRYTGRIEGRLYVASRKVLAEENKIVRLAKEGKATLKPLAPKFQPDRNLNAEQRAAVSYLLSHTGTIAVVIGDAGVGKTTLLNEARRGCPVPITALSPTTAAANNLRNEGFPHANTVARFLTDPKFRESARGGVILIDEAGMLGTEATAKVLGHAKHLEARVWLVGDDKQHGSPARGSPLGLVLEEVEPASVKKIQRQKGGYKALVELARDHPAQAVEQMQAKGWLVEVESHEKMAEDYLEKSAKGSVLAIAPTHAEGAAVTDAIRGKLRESGKIGEEREFTRLVDRQLTAAQRETETGPGDVVQFNQNVKGHKRGTRLEVESPPPYPASCYEVYRPEALRIAVGDTLRITRNGYAGKHRLSNGDLLKVKGFSPEGDVIDAKGRVLPKAWGHWAHGYVATSHASQSRTVDHVLISMGKEGLGAAGREQFYVSVSRGRKSAMVYTDDAGLLRRAVQRGDERHSARDVGDEPKKKGLMATVIDRIKRLTRLDRTAERGVDRAREERNFER
jgi:conjugative relaxase-like TrwC/TraI family protein